MGLRGPQRKKFTDEVVAEAKQMFRDGARIDDVCRHIGISRPTLYKYGIVPGELRDRNQVRGFPKRVEEPEDERVTLVRSIQTRLDTIQFSLEGLDVDDMNLSVSQSLTALAHLRQWVVDIEDCILIDQKLERLSG